METTWLHSEALFRPICLHKYSVIKFERLLSVRQLSFLSRLSIQSANAGIRVLKTPHVYHIGKDKNT